MGKRRAKDDEDNEDDCGCETLFRYGCDCLGFIGCGLLVLAVYLLLGGYWPDPPARYSVAIGAVSGLDPATDLRDGRALDPAFNLTIRVDATGRKNDGACLDESISVQVSYLRVPLAVGRSADAACAEAGGRSDMERRAGEAWPCLGFLLDSLAEDLRRGVAVFEVTLMSPCSGGWDVTTCRGKVGDAATLEAPCSCPSWVKAVVLPVPQQLGGSSGGGLGRSSRKVGHDVADEDGGSSPAGTLASI